MQIDIDFEVFKSLTALRESESDSYNNVIRRLLKLPSPMILLRDLAGLSAKQGDVSLDAQPAGMTLGVWFGRAHFLEGTKFRATYKGRTYLAEIRDGKWIGEDGKERRSPSDAAGAISGTNVNGWRFWFAQSPTDPAWRRLDELR